MGASQRHYVNVFYMDEQYTDELIMRTDVEYMEGGDSCYEDNHKELIEHWSNRLYYGSYQEMFIVYYNGCYEVLHGYDSDDVEWALQRVADTMGICFTLPFEGEWYHIICEEEDDEDES